MQRNQEGGNGRKGMVQGDGTENSTDGPGARSAQRGRQLAEAEVSCRTGESRHLTEETGQDGQKAESDLPHLGQRHRDEYNQVSTPRSSLPCGPSQWDGLQTPFHRPRRCDSERQCLPRQGVWLLLSCIHKASQTPVGKLLESH